VLRCLLLRQALSLLVVLYDQVSRRGSPGRVRGTSLP
jgi:hypothetical protein